MGRLERVGRVEEAEAGARYRAGFRPHTHNPDDGAGLQSDAKLLSVI